MVPYSTLRIGLYLFYGKKVITQFQKNEKKVISHRARLRENDTLPFSRAPAIKKKSPFFNARALVTREISIGNHMISSAIWDKLARVNFSKTNQIARARRASAICSL